MVPHVTNNQAGFLRLPCHTLVLGMPSSGILSSWCSEPGVEGQAAVICASFGSQGEERDDHNEQLNSHGGFPEEQRQHVGGVNAEFRTIEAGSLWIWCGRVTRRGKLPLLLN